MKAREYARIIQEHNSDVDIFVKIADMFLKETHEIIMTRKCKSDSAMNAVFCDQELKWKALCRLVEGLKPTGFREIVKMVFPAVFPYISWPEMRASNKIVNRWYRP